ncbi:hypothetical protein B0H13DRAFT_2486111 [Mycena leptocephala]|nr:hypothetical protein B0H13DRAFT_2486111 [Mycena leptocephala]
MSSWRTRAWLGEGQISAEMGIFGCQSASDAATNLGEDVEDKKWMWKSKTDPAIHSKSVSAMSLQEKICVASWFKRPLDLYRPSPALTTPESHPPIPQQRLLLGVAQRRLTFDAIGLMYQRSSSVLRLLNYFRAESYTRTMRSLYIRVYLRISKFMLLCPRRHSCLRGRFECPRTICRTAIQDPVPAGMLVFRTSPIAYARTATNAVVRFRQSFNDSLCALDSNDSRDKLTSHISTARSKTSDECSGNLDSECKSATSVTEARGSSSGTRWQIDRTGAVHGSYHG